MAKCGECLMNDVEIVELGPGGICPRCGANYGAIAAADAERAEVHGPMVLTPEFLAAVVAHIAVDAGLVATVEYPACVVIPDGRGRTLWFGTADGERWGCTVHDAQGEPTDAVHAVEFCAAAETNPAKVARALVRSLFPNNGGR